MRRRAEVHQEQQAQAYNAAVIVDNAIYVDGHRTAEPATLEETYEAVRNRRGVAWIGLYKPTEEEFSSVAGEFGLHGLAVEDATDAHQRPKLSATGIRYSSCSSRPVTWTRRRGSSSAKSTSLWEKTSW